MHRLSSVQTFLHAYLLGNGNEMLAATSADVNNSRLLDKALLDSRMTCRDGSRSTRLPPFSQLQFRGVM
jgi:hypothetical protein